MRAWRSDETDYAFQFTCSDCGHGFVSCAAPSNSVGSSDSPPMTVTLHQYGSLLCFMAPDILSLNDRVAMPRCAEYAKALQPSNQNSSRSARAAGAELTGSRFNSSKSSKVASPALASYAKLWQLHSLLRMRRKLCQAHMRLCNIHMKTMFPPTLCLSRGDDIPLFGRLLQVFEEFGNPAALSC